MQGCMFKSPCRRAVRLAIFLGLLPCSGCVFLEKDAAKKAPVGPVHQIQSRWNAEVMMVNQGIPGGKALAGLSGRVYLFGPELKFPVAAKGDKSKIVVDMTFAVNNQPQRPIKWEFTKSQLDQLLRQDILGWGYTLPLPWAEYQPGVKQVTMQVTYVPESGNPITGRPASFVLQQPRMQATTRQVPVLADAAPAAQQSPEPFSLSARR